MVKNGCSVSTLVVACGRRQYVGETVGSVLGVISRVIIVSACSASGAIRVTLLFPLIGIFCGR